MDSEAISKTMKITRWNGITKRTHKEKQSVEKIVRKKWNFPHIERKYWANEWRSDGKKNIQTNV